MEDGMVMECYYCRNYTSPADKFPCNRCLKVEGKPYYWERGGQDGRLAEGRDYYRDIEPRDDVPAHGETH